MLELPSPVPACEEWPQLKIPLPSLLLIVRLPRKDSTPSPQAVSDDFFHQGTDAGLRDEWSVATDYFCHSSLLNPANVAAVNNLAVAYARRNRLPEALLTIRRAAELLESEAGAEAGSIYANLAVLAAEEGWFDVALEAADRAVSCYHSPQTLFAAALVYAARGLVERSLELYREVLSLDPNHALASRNMRFMQTLTDCGPQELAKHGQEHYKLLLARAGKSQAKGEAPQLSLNGKPLRVGYVSGDFRTCSPAFIFAGVVLHHSPTVEAYFYSSAGTSPDDGLTRRFLAAAGPRWRDISMLSDAEAEELIRKDKIDILVDLDGHSGALVIRSSGGRLALFLRRPAPIQVTAWGFAHGTSCPEIDYFLADPVVVPVRERCYYAEHVVDLPCIVTFEPPAWYGFQDSSVPPRLHDGIFTYGCFARFEKLSDRFLRTVCDILQEAPNSRVIFKDHAFNCPDMIRHVKDRLPGLRRERILFSAGSSHLGHLWSYRQCDLMLDPFPHSGGTAALEQLWMGVPIVTLYGNQAAGRTTASILRCMNRQSWIAASQDEYIVKATQLGTDLLRLDDMGKARNTLRKELENSPVMNGYVAAVEASYRWMVQQKVETCATVK